MNNQKLIAGVCPLDKTKPAPKKLKKVSHLPLPDHDKWIGYRRDLVVPFTINPSDKSRPSPFSKVWGDLYVPDKIRRIKKFFMTYDTDAFEDYFICFEFGDKNGRFHCHGLIKIQDGCKTNYFHFVESIQKNFSDKKYKKRCYKGDTFNSMKNEAFEKSYIYVTKDINVVYKSMYKIKYIEKNNIVKALQRREDIKKSCKILNQI